MSSAPPTPAICQTCGTAFAMPGIFGPGVRVQLTNVGIGPCPNCGGTGLVPDGYYDFTGDVLNVFSTWPAERLQRLATTLQAAKTTADRSAVEQALGTQPDLATILGKLSPLRDAPTFWAFVTALLTAILLILASQSDPNVVVNEQTVIEKITAHPEPTVPKATRKKPPLPPRKQLRMKQQKRRK